MTNVGPRRAWKNVLKHDAVEGEGREGRLRCGLLQGLYHRVVPVEK